MFARSWQLTKMSFGIIKQDKEMLLFPLLAGLFSIAYSVALLFPTVVLELMRGNADNIVFNALDYALLFATYLGLAFIATFFNTCVVYTTKTRLDGGDATFMDSIKFALSRLHRILVWSLVAATVGILLRALDQAAERAGAIGGILLSILHAILGAVWSLITIFVVPAMVYDDLGPIDAIKRSTKTLKETWGESLIRHFGLGAIQFLFFLLGIALAFAAFILLSPLGTVGLIAAAAFTFVYFLSVVLIFNVANNVYNTALYAHARGVATPGFSEDVLVGAFRMKG